MEILQITIVIYFLLLQPEDGSKVMYFLQLHSVHVKSQADIAAPSFHFPGTDWGWSKIHWNRSVCSSISQSLTSGIPWLLFQSP